MTGNPGFRRKAFGGTTVAALSDGGPNPPNEALLAIRPAEAAARGSQPRSGVNALLVPFGGRDVLVDTGAGAKARPTLDRTLVTNSQLFVCLWARRSAQPAPTAELGSARGAKHGLPAGPANSSPVSEP